jgi:hypothetical protein
MLGSGIAKYCEASAYCGPGDGNDSGSCGCGDCEYGY